MQFYKNKWVFEDSGREVWLSDSEVAFLLQISARTVQRWRLAREMPNGYTWRYLRGLALGWRMPREWINKGWFFEGGELITPARKYPAHRIEQVDQVYWLLMQDQEPTTRKAGIIQLFESWK